MPGKPHFLPKLAALTGATLLAAGCSALTTTSNGIRDGFHATTKTTSSTSGSGDEARRDNQAVAFVQSQLPAIREEAARGTGENLDTLAYLLNKKSPDAFGQWMQAHYQPLFANLKQPRELLSRIHSYQR